MIDRATVDRIKDAANIVEVVSWMKRPVSMGGYGYGWDPLATFMVKKIE